MSISTLEETQEAIEQITDTLIMCHDPDKFSSQDFRAANYLRASHELEDVIATLPPEKTILFTVGDKPVYARLLLNDALGVVQEEDRTLGFEGNVGPRESLELTSTRWIANILIGSKRAGFGNSLVEIGVVGLAKALAENASLTIVDTSIAQAVAIKY